MACGEGDLLNLSLVQIALVEVRVCEDVHGCGAVLVGLVCHQDRFRTTRQLAGGHLTQIRARVVWGCRARSMGHMHGELQILPNWVPVYYYVLTIYFVNLTVYDFRFLW